MICIFFLQLQDASKHSDALCTVTAAQSQVMRIDVLVLINIGKYYHLLFMLKSLL